MPIHHTPDHPDSFGITYTGEACRADRHEEPSRLAGKGRAGTRCDCPCHLPEAPAAPKTTTLTKATTSSSSSPSIARPVSTTTVLAGGNPPTVVPAPVMTPTSDRIEPHDTHGPPVSSSAVLSRR